MDSTDERACTRTRYTAAEVARAAGCAIKTVHSNRQRGHLKATRTGKAHWVYLEPDVAAWLEWRLRRG